MDENGDEMGAVYDENLDETAVDDSKEETYVDFDMNEVYYKGEYNEDKLTPVTGYFDRFISLT